MSVRVHAPAEARRKPPPRSGRREQSASRALEETGPRWSFSSLPVVAGGREVVPSTDPAEVEARRVARRVTSDEAAVAHARTCTCGGTCPACRRARLLPSHRGRGAPGVDGGVVDAALRSGGEPLRADLRSHFEERLGADFSNVRVHRDADAARSADALDAHAYALGNHVVFGPGEYRPDSLEGRRLLAHELAHVAQVDGRPERIHRDEKQQQARVDVAIVLDGDAESLPAARALAPIVIRVHSAEEIKSELAKIGKPVRTLFVVSHSNAAGELKFESKIGTISWVKVSDLGAPIKGALPGDKAPDLVEFRGCKLGEATEELGRFRARSGAKAATGSSCWTFVDVRGPIYINDVAITSESQVTKDNEALFNKGLKRLVGEMQATNGRKVKNCIVGLAAGETADKNMAKIRRQYFAGRGTLTAEWASPEYNTDWQAGSRCVKDLTATSKPCRLTTKTAMLEPTEGEAATRTAAAEPVHAEGDGTPEPEEAPA